MCRCKFEYYINLGILSSVTEKRKRDESEIKENLRENQNACATDDTPTMFRQNNSVYKKHVAFHSIQQKNGLVVKEGCCLICRVDRQKRYRKVIEMQDGNTSGLSHILYASIQKY